MTDVLDYASVFSRWGIAGPARLVAARENRVFEAFLPGGARIALRVHRKGYRSAAAIHAELTWAEALALRDVACPAPVRTQDGALLARAEDGHVVSAVSWLDGQPLRPEAARLEALGAEIARFHAAADALSSHDELPRLSHFPAWTSETLLGDTPAWGQFWTNPSLSPDAAKRLNAVRPRLRAELDRSGAGGLGLIHADLLPDNVLDDGARVALIDFDDCGLGFRAYDLATALVSHISRHDHGALQDALLSGYSSVLRPSQDLAREVALCVVVRCLASCGWAASRLVPGDPRCRAYAERAIGVLDRWMDGAL